MNARPTTRFRAAKKAVAKKVVAKKAAAKKTTPKKTAVKKAAPVKKTTVKKTAAKKASAKKVAPIDEAEALARLCAQLADDTKAEEIVLLDLRGIVSIADWFVLCNGTSLPHLKAIAREVKGGVAERLNRRARSTDGQPDSQWLVLDYGDVLVHIFHPSKRDVYALEDLWSDGRRVPYVPNQPA